MNSNVMVVKVIVVIPLSLCCVYNCVTPFPFEVSYIKVTSGMCHIHNNVAVVIIPSSQMVSVPLHLPVASHVLSTLPMRRNPGLHLKLQLTPVEYGWSSIIGVPNEFTHVVLPLYSGVSGGQIAIELFCSSYVMLNIVHIFQQRLLCKLITSHIKTHGSVSCGPISQRATP